MIGSVYNNATIYTDASYILYTWSSNGSYVIANSIEPGKGYWLLVFGDAKVRIE